MVLRTAFLVSTIGFFLMLGGPGLAQVNDDAISAEILAQSDKLTEAFNAGRADDVAAVFLPKGELIDEEGTVYRGSEEIKTLLTAFFEKFPGTRMMNEIESIRPVGPVVIQEGTRVTISEDGTEARIRHITVLAKTDGTWRIASMRDFADETPPSSGEMLQSLDWIVGSWLNEGSDARVEINYRWSDDGNFILGDISVHRDGNVVMSTSQRIGWDPLMGQPRSWIFDSDGGYAEATWHQIEDTWVVRSAAVMPDGMTGSAIVTISPGENGRFIMNGTDRLVGGVLEDDYEITVVKQPPAAGK
jgi:uncharacterized protein (TIGR02246 family)